MLNLTHRATAALALLALLSISCGGAAPRPTASPVGAVPSPTQGAAVTSAAPPTAGASPIVSAAPGASFPDLGSLIPSDPALFGTGLVPDGWQVIEDATNTCRIAVPPEWTTDVAPGTGQTSILAEGVASVSVTTQEWEEFTASVDQFYLTGHVILADTDDVFLIANPIGPDYDLSYILGLRFDDANCMVLVTVQRNWISQYAAPAALVSQTLDHTD